MNRIFKSIMKTIAFVLPLFLFASPVLLSGEQLNGGEVAQMQHIDNRSMLYGSMTTWYRYYKAESTRILKPEVLILGQSRALQVRSFFFEEDIPVFNAGYAALTTADMQYFLEMLDLKSIDILIMVVDQMSFNAKNVWGGITYPSHNDYIEFSHKPVTVLMQKQLLENYYSQGKTIYTKNILNPDIIGQTAKIGQSGMLNDGSYYYGHLYQIIDTAQNAKNQVSDALEQIDNANGSFQYGEHLDPDAVFYLRQLLQYCNENDIYVIAYAPPYAPTVNTAMKAKGKAYGYQQEALEVIPQIFDEFNFEFYDFTDAAFLDCTDEYYLDGFHGSDVVFLRMFINMIENGSRLSEYCSLEDLYKYDEERFSNTRLLDTWEQYNEAWLQRKK